MPNEFSRSDRLASQVRKELAYLLGREVKDPAVSMITVQDVELTADLSYAKIYYTVLSDADLKDVQKGLERARGFLRSRLGKSLSARKTPELRFIYDDSAVKGDYLDALIIKARNRDRELS